MSLSAVRQLYRAGLLCCALLSLVAHARTEEAGVSADKILIGQSNAFSGALTELGREYTLGIKTYFDQVNQNGGVNGRKLELISLDDAYDPKKTLENTKTLINDKKVFALGFYIGAANTEGVIPLLNENKIPLIGTLSGADSLRAPTLFSRYLFHTKAGYMHELARMVQQISSTGMKNVAVVFQNNAFGKQGLATINEQLKKQGITPVASVAVETDSTNIDAALKTVAAQTPSAVVLITAGAVTSNFIRGYSKAAQRAQFYTLSFVATSGLIKDLGELSRGIVVTQTSPFPWSVTMPIIKDYQQSMKKAGIDNFGMLSMEGYIAARIVVMGLRKAGRDLTRLKFVQALETVNSQDVGDYNLNYSQSNHNGSSFVDLTLIDRNGKFIR